MPYLYAHETLRKQPELLNDKQHENNNIHRNACPALQPFQL